MLVCIRLFIKHIGGGGGVSGILVVPISGHDTKPPNIILHSIM